MLKHAILYKHYCTKQMYSNEYFSCMHALRERVCMVKK